MTFETDLVTFDVIGTKFRLRKELFDKYPSSLFFKLTDRKKFEKLRVPQCVTKIRENKFYVQRCPDLMKIVIEYCINGKLHVPSCLCSDQVAEEFHFWKIKYEKVCLNCSSHHQDPNEPSDLMLERLESDSDLLKKSNGCRIRSTLWTFMEYPHSTTPAFVFFIFSMLITTVSIVNIILMSLPQLQYCPPPHNNNNSSSNSSGTSEQHGNKKDSMSSEDDFFETDCTGTYAFKIIDMSCMSWFSLELIARLILCPSYKNFFMSIFTYIDVFSVLPFYVDIIIWAIDTDSGYHLDKIRAILLFLRIFKLFQVFRVFRLARRTLSIKVLGRTLKSAKDDLVMLLVFIFLALLIFSNCLYQLEKDMPNTLFTSIPASCWWCIVTFTTVGYGDMVPETILGKIVAGMTCVCGVLLIGFPIAILVEKFTSTYKDQKSKDKEKRRRKRLLYQSSSASRSHSFSIVRRKVTVQNRRPSFTDDTFIVYRL